MGGEKEDGILIHIVSGSQAEAPPALGRAFASWGVPPSQPITVVARRFFPRDHSPLKSTTLLVPPGRAVVPLQPPPAGYLVRD